ncbi:hypothetical protein KSGM81_04533 [Klebsiella quasipneumoniae]|nr:hypothetical protein KSGM81_04533 [Klebsiella quasipneumoniae]
MSIFNQYARVIVGHQRKAIEHGLGCLDLCLQNGVECLFNRCDPCRIKGALLYLQCKTESFASIHLQR